MQLCAPYELSSALAHQRLLASMAQLRAPVARPHEAVGLCDGATAAMCPPASRVTLPCSCMRSMTSNIAVGPAALLLGPPRRRILQLERKYTSVAARCRRQLALKCRRARPASPVPAPPQVLAQEIVFPEQISVRLATVGGLERVQDVLRAKVLLPLQRPDMFSSSLLRLERGVLLYGRPGAPLLPPSPLPCSRRGAWARKKNKTVPSHAACSVTVRARPSRGPRSRRLCRVSGKRVLWRHGPVYGRAFDGGLLVRCAGTGKTMLAQVRPPLAGALRGAASALAARSARTESRQRA